MTKMMVTVMEMTYRDVPNTLTLRTNVLTDRLLTAEEEYQALQKKGVYKEEDKDSADPTHHLPTQPLQTAGPGAV